MTAADLLTPLHYDFMLRAIVASALVGGVGGFLSCFVTLRGWSLLGDALSHAVVPGVALAYLASWPFSVGAFISGLLAAAAMTVVNERTKLREDVVIGIVFTTFFAFGLLLISLYPSKVDLRTIVLGNILGIAPADVWQLVIVSILTLVALLLKWKDLVLVTFDPGQARALGLPTVALHTLLLTLLSATAVAALQAVGACLVVAVLVTPGATAYLLTDRFGRMIWIATLVGAASGAVGAYVSWFFHGATGGCIVVLQTLVFLAAWIFAPKHGHLATWRRQREVAA